MPGIWLSIDWDFFHFEDPQWDWGHRETIFHRDGMMWQINAISALARDLDLRKAMDPEKYAPGPSGFWKALQRAGFTFPAGLRLAVADSHTFGAHFFIPLADGEPRELLHFDAHHDLGYEGKAAMDKRYRNQRVECGSWLYHVMRRNRKLATRLVYPVWKGLKEIGASKDMGWMGMPSMAARVRALTPSSPSEYASVWSEEALKVYANHRTPETMEVEGIFIARSGSWSPPWQDNAFIQFVREVETLSGSRPILPWRADEKCDPLMPREFDWSAVEQQGNDMKAFFNNSADGSFIQLKART